MRKRVLLALALVACSAPRPRPPRGDPALTVEGRIENGPFVFGLEDLADLPRRTFSAAAPFRRGPASASFEGVTLPALLEATMEVMRDADTAVFHGDAGTVAVVPMPVLRQLQPVLADRVDGAGVQAWRAGARPLQLAWPNLDNPGVDSDPRMRWWWVTGVHKVALQSWRTTFGRALRVPPGAPDEARLGADLLSSQCVGCHRVRGAGGTRGPALTREPPLSRERLLAVLEGHLGEHSSLERPPELTRAQAGAVAAFLEVVALAGARVDEELPGLAPPDEPLAPPPRTGPYRRVR
jgi:mono/diheme cytochrome c family protein